MSLFAADEGIFAGSVAERLAAARALDLPLEVRIPRGFDAAPYAESGHPFPTAQAWDLHELSPLHPDREIRADSAKYVAEVLDCAARLAIPRVLVVCSYGAALRDRPAARAVDFLDRFRKPLRERGMRMLVEPLSPLRTDVLTAPDEVAALLAELDDPAAYGLALDTGHLLDSELEPAKVLAAHPDVALLQLRGREGAAPPREILEGEGFPEDLAPEVVSLEFRKPVSPSELRDLLAAGRARFAS